MWIVRLALRRPYSVAAFCFVVFILGALSISRMKVDILPAIDIPVVIVVWNYPGLPADEMETRVVFISERALSTTVSGISRIESQSIPGIGLLRVYFEPGTDIGGAIAQVTSVSSSLLRVLPPGMQAPTILRFNASNVPVAQLTLSGQGVPEQQLYDYALNFLRVRLFTIPGLSTPAPYGGRQRQIMVDIDPGKLAARGLSAQDVVQAVLQSNVILPAGAARIGQREYDVKLNGSPLQAEAFNDLPLQTVGGVPLRLRDVANVHEGFAVQNNVVRINGRRATYLVILRKENASTLAVVDSVRDLLPSIKAAAPQGIVFSLDFDQSVFVRAAVMSVLREAAMAAVLVSLMVLFFLGSWRSTVLVSTSIPLAILVGVVGLFLTGQSLNLMTLGGLALAVGVLVDDATVEVENIHRNRMMKKGLTRAILDGAHQVAVPALAATLTLCIVFFPVVLLQGAAKFLFTPLALSVVFSMLASYLLSRTLVPTLARKLMKREPIEHGEGGPEGAAPGGPGARRSGWQRFNAWRDRHFDRFREGYAAVLAGALNECTGVLVGFGLLFLVALALLTVVGLDFFPRVDTGQMRLHFRAPVGTRIEETELQVQAVEDAIRRVIPPPELATLNDNIGLPASYNLGFVPTDNAGGQDAEIRVALKPGHRPTEEYLRTLRERLPEEFPGAVFYFQAADLVSQVLNFGISAPIDIQVEGRDEERSFEIARGLIDPVRRIPGTVDVRIPQIYDHPALQVNVDRDSAATLNVSERDVANSMLTSLSSSSLVNPSFWLDPVNRVSYPVVVQTPITELKTLQDLMATSVTPSGPPLPAAGASPNPNVPPAVFQAQAPRPPAPYLGSVSRVRPADDPAYISHYTVQPVVDIQCAVDGRDLGSVARDIDRLIRKVKLPPGMAIHVRGQSESMITSFQSLGLGMILAVALVYLLLAVLFQSWLDPFIIMVAVPGAFMGVLWMLAITGTTLNVESFMGAIMAVGIAVSNSILLVSFANEIRVEKGLSPNEAALEAGRTRLRPVLMTALAMILGMLPMALALGEGGEQNAPLGRAVIGGLVVATFVTLLVVPLVYARLRKAEPTKHRLDEEFAREAGEAHGGAGVTA